MSERPPDFDELVGVDIGAGERRRLLRAHEALLSVDLAPELSPSLAVPPAIDVSLAAPGRRPWRALALAAALAVTLFAVGVAVGDRADDPGTFEVVTMSGTANAPGASASLQLFDVDAAGNWPMEISVRGLLPAAEGRRYELWLTRSGELAELCGSFLAGPDGTAVVPMNAPWRLDAFDGWVVVEEDTRAPVLSA